MILGQNTEPPTGSRPGVLPAQAAAPALLLAAVAYGTFIFQMGGYSDDHCIAATLTGSGFWPSVRQTLTAHHPRLTTTLIKYAIFNALYPSWPAIHAAALALFLCGVAAAMALVWRWTASAPATAVAGLLLALHPGVNDTALWSSCLMLNVLLASLAGAFWILTDYAERGGGGRLAAGSLLYFFSCVSYEQCLVFAPAFAALAWIGPAWKKRGAAIAAGVFAAALAAAAVQRSLAPYPYQAELDVKIGLFARLVAVLIDAGRILTVGRMRINPAYDPVHSLTAGWAALRGSPIRLVGLAAALIAAGAFLIRGGIGRAAPQPDGGRRTAVFAAIGAYVAIAGVALFALRARTPLAVRHVFLPLLGLSILVGLLTAALHRGAGIAGAPRGRQVAFAIWLGGWLLFAGAAALADVGDGSDYAASWRRQKQTVAAIAACHDSPLPADAIIAAENLPSHIGKVPVFSDNWSLGPLLQSELPSLFGQTRGGSEIVYAAEAQPEEKLAHTIVYVFADDRVSVRDSMRFWRDGALEKEIPLPVAAAARCPREPMDLRILDRPYGIAFENIAGLLVEELIVRPDDEVPVADFYFRLAPQSPERYPLDIEICDAASSDGGRCWRTTMNDPGATGATIRSRFSFPHAYLTADSPLRLTVRDRRGAPLTWQSAQPLARQGSAAILRWPRR